MMIVEEESRRIVCEIREGPTGSVTEMWVDAFAPDGAPIKLTPDKTLVGTITMTNCTFEDCGGVINIG
jgi:hypothetical protein